jgi:hypothetical protein
MSVKDFELAFVGNPQVRYAIVSETLFFALDNLGKIYIRQIEKELPENPDRYGPVRKLLRSDMERSGKPLTLTYFVLTEKPDVHVDCVLLHRIRVDETGPNSFVLC